MGTAPFLLFYYPAHKKWQLGGLIRDVRESRDKLSEGVSLHKCARIYDNFKSEHLIIEKKVNGAYI